MTRRPDPAFDALVEATRANVEMERGRLNAALKAIRIAWQREGGLPEDLPREIPLRAKAYKLAMPKMMLTPTALAVHWSRVIEESSSKTAQEQAMEELRKESE